jgi:hypothetical protein
MVVKTEPIPYMKSAYNYGARTAREEALLKGLDASSRQTEMNKAHSGGARITVPQIHTGASGDAVINAHMASLNRALTQHAANSEFDKLAVTNSLVKKGGRKSKTTRKTKITRKSKKNKTRKMKKTIRK